jgi:hypothetical protein
MPMGSSRLTLSETFLIQKEETIARKKKTKKLEAAQSAATNQMIYIRILQSVVTIPNTTSIKNPDPSTPLHLYLIKGSLDDIARYAGSTVNWIIKVANLICDPSGASRIYTHTEGTPSYWYDRKRNADWRQVTLGDPLIAGIYEFVTTGPITLSRISERRDHSLTSNGSVSNAATFRRDLDLRDGVCVVTQEPASFSLIASHLVPKRVGDDGAKEIITRFVGAGMACHIHKFHPRLGILLLSTLDNFVDRFKLGFYHDTVRNL